MSLCFLVALVGLSPACFSPDSDNGALAETEGEGDSSGEPTTGAETSTGGDTSSSTTDPSADTDDPMDTTGEVDPTDETGSTETGELDETGSTDTGELCMEELGTEQNCLACDDTCAEDETCTPGGCAAPDAVGFSEPFAGVGGYPNRLWGFSVEVEQDAWLGSLNFHGVGNGGDIQLALYSDAAGSPSDLLALSEPLDSYSAGPYTLEVDPIALPAGTYWLMARNDFPSQIGLDFDPDILPPFELTAIDLDFGDPLPETLENPTTFPSYPINLWMTVLLPS